MNEFEKNLEELKETCDKLSSLIDTFKYHGTSAQVTFLQVRIEELLANPIVQRYIDTNPFN